jgi:hypothetical protein
LLSQIGIRPNRRGSGRQLPSEAELLNSAETKIYRLFGVCAFVATAAFIVPRFVSNPEGGFASGSSAIVTLLIMLGLTLLFSLYLLRVTIQHYSSLSALARVAGIVPSLVLAVALLGLVGFLSY